MKKRLLVLFILAIFSALFLTACEGDLEVTGIDITGGLKTTYNIGETPDFSAVTATVYFNDGNSKEVSYSELTFGDIDTATAGNKILDIKYNGFTKSVQITVKGESFNGGSGQIILGTFLPDSLTLREEHYLETFKNPNNPYVVGDDNPFRFSLKLTVLDGNTTTDISDYRSASTVYIKGSDTPLSGDELARYVLIDEDKNSFDFTEDAVGMSFTIATRPADIPESSYLQMTKSIDVTVVDGYNIYEAYELNYITNTAGFKFSSVNSADKRNQLQVVDDFLKNEKGVIRPEGIASIVMHNNLTIERTDLPSEFFLNNDRSNDLYEIYAIFLHFATAENKEFAIHGNYFSIHSHKLPNIVTEGVGNQKDMASDTALFSFDCAEAHDKYFNHKEYSTKINNLMVVDNEPQSDNIENGTKSLYGLVGIRTKWQVTELNNIKLQSFLINLQASGDYQTIYLNESVLYNSWQSHIQLLSSNPLQSANEEPLPKGEYPRLTLNINNSYISQCGGPAIIMNTNSPQHNSNKHSGSEVNISKNSTVESWVTGDEAWFKSLGLSSIVEIIKGYEKTFNNYDSSFIKEEMRDVVNKDGTVTSKSFKLINFIAINLLVPDLTQDFNGIYGQIKGDVDVDGKITVGGTTIMNMDDVTVGDKTYNYANTTVADLKAQNSSNSVFETSTGDVACASPNRPLVVEKGDFIAESDEFLALYFYSASLVFGNYHPLK